MAVTWAASRTSGHDREPVDVELGQRLFAIGHDDASWHVGREHQPHAAVGRGAVRRVGGARADPVAVAVRMVAQERAALHHLAAPARRPGRVDAVGPVVGGEPVRAPLPDVAGAVVQTESVGRERVDRRPAGIAVLGRVAIRKRSLPDVAAVLAAGLEVVAPAVDRLLQPAARGQLPLRLGGQASPFEPRQGHRVVPGDVRDRLVQPPVQRAAGSLRLRPAGAGHPAPPCHARNLANLVSVGDRFRHVRMEHERPAEQLGLRDVAGGGDEAREAVAGHAERVAEERRDGHLAHRPLTVGREPVRVVGAHQEAAAGDRNAGGKRFAAPALLGADSGQQAARGVRSRRRTRRGAGAGAARHRRRCRPGTAGSAATPCRCHPVSGIDPVVGNRPDHRSRLGDLRRLTGRRRRLRTSSAAPPPRCG